ncbi:MAG: hypothetical protein MUO91_03610 [candidate division Zixibacteria bacterium]|nr:hypothetical protein [candidate division Zixibacteria bacterium]
MGEVREHLKLELVKSYQRVGEVEKKSLKIKVIENDVSIEMLNNIENFS